MDQDGELFPIYAEDDFYVASFWSEVIGSTIDKLVVLRPIVLNIKESYLPCEVGLRFQLQNGLSFLASHGLHNDSDDFSVLEESQIAPIELEELGTIRKVVSQRTKKGTTRGFEWHLIKR